MDHKLRVLVGLDIDSTTAVLEVIRCLTESNCLALVPIIRRTAALVDGSARSMRIPAMVAA